MINDNGFDPTLWLDANEQLAYNAQVNPLPALGGGLEALFAKLTGAAHPLPLQHIVSPNQRQHPGVIY